MDKFIPTFKSRYDYLFKTKKKIGKIELGVLPKYKVGKKMIIGR